MESSSPLERAIWFAGGVSKLAKQLGLNHTNVSQWRASGYVPPKQRIAIERFTGGRIRAIDFDSLSAGSSGAMEVTPGE